MAKSNPDLWRKLQAYHFDDLKVELPYSARLTQDEGWSATDTGRVIDEYRRFLYLSQIMDGNLAPPGPIDAAWTRHLLYTRDYWERFVPGVLGGRALHRATAIAKDQAEQRAYLQALRVAYRREFGEAPPRDIWVHPLRPDFGALIAIFMIAGFFGGMLAFGLGWAISFAMGLEFGGEVRTLPEKVASAVFIACCASFVLSPLWAWIVTRFQNRLKTNKRTGGWSTSVMISVDADRS